MTKPITPEEKAKAYNAIITEMLKHGQAMATVMEMGPAEMIRSIVSALFAADEAYAHDGKRVASLDFVQAVFDELMERAREYAIDMDLQHASKANPQ